MRFELKFNFLITLTFSIFISGCCSLQPDSVPIMEASSKWELQLSCDFSSGCREIDVLKNDQITLLIDLNKSTIKNDIFTMSIMFLTPETETFSYNPNMTHLKIYSEKISSFGFPCSNTIYGIETFKSGTQINDDVALNGYVHERQKVRYTCFILYFDSPPPKLNDQFSIQIGGLKKNGTTVDIPILKYSKGKRML